MSPSSSVGLPRNTWTAGWQASRELLDFTARHTTDGVGKPGLTGSDTPDRLADRSEEPSSPTIRPFRSHRWPQSPGRSHYGCWVLAAACLMSGSSSVYAPFSTMALLENGIEDEKASAGKHRALGRSAHDSSSLEPWNDQWVQGACSLAISMRSPSGERASQPRGSHSGVGSLRSRCAFGQLEILTESLILAQDERWRRA